MRTDRTEGAYIKDIFARLDLQQIREFLLYGAGNYDMQDKTYAERLKEASGPVFSNIESLFADDKPKREKAASDVSHALSTYNDVYMEIGMKAGARLVYQLLLVDTPPENSAEE